MKINSINILNFMRIGEVDADLTGTHIHLFCGKNEVGKSTLQESIRMACFGETVRVVKKGDYPLMVKDGAKKGTVSVDLDGVVFTRDVATGKLKTEVELPPDALRYSLNAHLFSDMTSDNRRKFLFKALGVKIKPADIKERLLKRDIDEECIDKVLPLLLSGGFGGAHTEAKKKTTESRGVWKGITHETYGAVKADTWEADKQFTEEHAEDLKFKKEALVDSNDLIDSLMVEKGAQSVTGKKRSHEGIQMDCPSCKAKLSYKMGVVSLYVEEKEELPDEAANNIDTEIAKEKSVRDRLQEEIVAIEIIQVRDENLDEVTKSAKDAHNKVINWKALEEILAPDGLPAEIISEALTPVNDRLKANAAATGWKLVSVTPSMEILMDGRPYGMQSESSKWRADTMITEAISSLTGTGVLVFDRVDVLDIEKRLELIKWMMSMKDDYESILMFATLKERPKMPAAISVHWMEAGALSDG